MMASFFHLLILFLLTLSTPPLHCHGESGATTTFSFDVHHRFSEKVRMWAESMSLDTTNWPEKGSVEYYTSLAEHDRALLHRRGLASTGGNGSIVTFVNGNSTIQVPTLGFLYYANVTLGTPPVDFMVALDTGSDLFWVPCNCTTCAPVANTNLRFNIYNLTSSSTSTEVPCSSNLCLRERPSCKSLSDPCPYFVQYVSNDSTSGILVEDVLHLTTENTLSAAPLDARITFGCGQVQIGSIQFGLMGLALGNLAVPNLLAAAGLTSASFSMCFGGDGTGRINLGDKGSSDQKHTPLIRNLQTPAYTVMVTEMQLGRTSIKGNFFAIMDTGTSFTILKDPMYTDFTRAFDSQIIERRITLPNVPFDFCYQLGPGQTTVPLPNVSFVMNGGDLFPIFFPIFLFRTNTRVIYCLAITQSNDFNIIGENFMTGLKLVFNKEDFVLGWKQFDCYAMNNSTTNASSLKPVVPVNPPLGSQTLPLVPTNNPTPSRPSSSHLNHPFVAYLFLLSTSIFLL